MPPISEDWPSKVKTSWLREASSVPPFLASFELSVGLAMRLVLSAGRSLFLSLLPPQAAIKAAPAAIPPVAARMRRRLMRLSQYLPSSIVKLPYGDWTGDPAGAVATSRPHARLRRLAPSFASPRLF